VRKKYFAAGLAVAALGTILGLTTTASAEAAVPAPVAGNVTVLSAAPRLVPSPGSAFTAGETKTFDVAGKTFSGVSIPSNATGVTVSITATNSAGAGKLTVWTTDAGQPGPGTVTYTVGGGQTNVASVGLNDKGQLNVYSSNKTQALISIQSYVTPLAGPAAPTVRQADAVAAKTINVGGSIRSRATDFGSITLPAGTYSASVRGTFTGFNNSTDLPSSVSVTGTLVVQKGDTMGDNFENNVTVGGIAIPRANSDTLTQDPTAAINDTIVLPAETTLHFKAFGYASDSSQRDSVLKFALNSATFVKL
jgi:hypothetical protein